MPSPTARVDNILLSGSITPSSANKVRLFRGRLRHNIATAEFLDRAGRPELARAVRGRRATRSGLVIAGGLAVVGGFGYLSSQSLDDDPTAPLFLMACGGGFLLGGLLLGDGVPEGAELRAIAETHNRALRDRLRDEPPSPSSPRPITARLQPAPAARLQLQLAPVVTPSGGGLTLMGRF